MSEASPNALTPADVDFDGVRPVSRSFGDVYFDADGPAEVARVFLGPAAFETRTADPATTFTVGEPRPPVAGCISFRWNGIRCRSPTRPGRWLPGRWRSPWRGNS